LIVYSDNDEDTLVTVLCEHTCIVDGPIASVQLTLHATADEQHLQLVVASLCGHVCELLYDITSNPTVISQNACRGPYMIDDQTDSVLCVCAYNECVAIGTQSGQCRVYERLESSSSSSSREYELQWYCQLPYCVHGVVLFEKSLLVTTRRSVHLFQLRRHVYDVDLAKSRLEELMVKHGVAPIIVSTKASEEGQQPEQPEKGAAEGVETNVVESNVPAKPTENVSVATTGTVVANSYTP
jgi:hypothetical protein